MLNCPDFKKFDTKLIAILRGVQNHEVEGIVVALLEEGFRAIEIPMNSPNPVSSITRAVDAVGQYSGQPCLVGAGTVLTVDQVRAVKSAGANLIVSPNTNPEVIRETVKQGMAGFPGVFTATEAHLAVEHGAAGLKFFPASLLGASGILAIKATLPDDAVLCAVGGVDHTNMSEFRKAGVSGFGLGSCLYKPGFTAARVRDRAAVAMKAWRLLTA